MKSSHVSKLYWRINQHIIAPQMRVIGPDAKQIGILSRDEAMAKAKEMKLDLVEVSGNAKPPVAKIVDFGKFRYQEEKKLKKELKKTKGGEVKEVRFSPFIADNDYRTRLERIKEFTGERNKVRVAVVFTGRQMNSKPFGYELLKRILSDLGEGISVDMEPKFMGRHLAMVVSPNTKGAKTNAETKNTQISNDQV